MARWICAHCTEPLSIDAIDAAAHMSPASLHRHFKAATGMSPLKYQKHLRLQEARRRLLGGHATAAQIAQAVGYVSATRFNREYRSSAQPDMPLEVYDKQRRTVDRVMAEAIRDGDAPAVVAKVIVAAATDAKPKVRHTAGPMAGRASTLRRVAPARTFDKQIRKMNRLAG